MILRRGRPAGRPRSLGLRLVLVALAWMVLVLVLAWFGLVALFRNHLETDLDSRAQFDLNRLIAALEVSEAGELTVADWANRRIYGQPYSGRYWQVVLGDSANGGDADSGGDPDAAGPDLLRSRSLWDQNLPLAAPPPREDGLSRWRSQGPDGQSLLLLARAVTLPETEGPVLAVVGIDRATIPAVVEEFGWQLGIALLGLAAVVAAAIGLQVWFGLAPLRRLRVELGRLREGTSGRLGGRWPGEVAPLVDDLNAVLAHNEAVVGRARAQAGDLAHALKTPIAVLAGAADAGSPDLAVQVVQQTQAMRRHIDRHLVRARAAGAAERPGARADLGEVLAGLLRAMRHLHPRPDLVLEPPTLGGRALFHGDREDAAEMLGCVLDNACAWARQRVRVSVMPAGPAPALPDSAVPGLGGGAQRGRRLRILVEDDGPGLSEEECRAVLERGVRLDEAMPGSGLGLAIVRDLAGIYDGGLELDRAPLGGLRVALTLPGHLEPAGRDAGRLSEKA